MTEEAFYLDPRFWVAVSFCVFVLLAFRPVGKILAQTLDTRSAQIAADLAEARRLREEAQATLDLYRRKQQESLKEAEAMLAQTKRDTESMAAQAEAELKTALDKRMKLASDRIAQSETKALQEVQEHVVDIAIAAARSLIREHLERSGGKELIRQAAAELERKLH
jgi:F-type H+-transporting ATPase subunit b